jgi:polygalacturonase
VNTFTAALYLALNPTTISSANSSSLWGLVTPTSPYSAATSQPADWTAPLGTITTSPLLATGDMRTVTQPTYPTICATLPARFPASDRSPAGLVAAASDDTGRIQTALSSVACKNTGEAVELALGTSGNNAFFSGLITATGEGLIVDSGVTLFGNDQYVSSSELVDFKGANSSLMGPGTVDGRSDVISTANTPRLIEVNPANGFVAYNVTLMRALHPALYVEAGNGITIWNVTIRTPANQNSADGIDIDSSSNVTATNNSVAAGDDGIAVKTNSGNVTNVTIQNNRLYGTHGLTVGSILANTVQNILFQNNYVYGNGNNLFGNATQDDSTTANAINIKVVPCTLTVTQVTYLNTCITTAKAVLRMYDTYATCSTGGTPTLNDIVVNGVLSTSSNSGNSTNSYGTTFQGNSSGDLMTVYLANIQLDATALAHPAPTTQDSTIFLNNVNFTPTGTGITADTTDYTATGNVPTCAF